MLGFTIILTFQITHVLGVLVHSKKSIWQAFSSQNYLISNCLWYHVYFRCLIHSEVYLAEFLGIHHVDAGTPAFIYSGYLQSLTHYISKNQATPETCKRILVETATALQYLHSKGLVHMELTKDSLTVRLERYCQ